MASNLSPEQLAQRLEGITATDISAIVGVHPYRSAVDVWQEKRGLAPPFEGNERTKWGNLLEPVIRSDYEERHGVRVEVHGTIAHPHMPWMMATPDGLVYRGHESEPSGGLEIKCHTVYLSHLYGDPGTDEVPPYELCQCAWSLGVTGLKRWDLVPFVDGMTSDYVIDRDDELISTLIERAERFRIDNVLAGNPPPPDGSESYSKWLAATHKADNAEAALIPIADNLEMLKIVSRLRELRDEIAELEGEEGIHVQSIKAVIGNHAGIEFPSGKAAPTKGKNKGIAPMDKITWKRAADSVHRDFSATFELVRSRAAMLSSAKEADVQRAIVALDKIAEATFENSRATITALEVRKLLADAYDLLRMIAAAEAISSTRPGSRRFVVPKSWKAKAEQETAAAA